MDKHTQTSGFTLLEVLITLTIVVFISTIVFNNAKNLTNLYLVDRLEVETEFLSNQLVALIEKKRTYAYIDGLSINFNGLANVSRAATISLLLGNKPYDFVIWLGCGKYEIR